MTTDLPLQSEKLELWDRAPDPCWSCGGEAEARDDIHVRCIDSKGINCEVMGHWFTRKTWNSRAPVVAPQGDDLRKAVSDFGYLIHRELHNIETAWHDCELGVCRRVRALLSPAEIEPTTGADGRYCAHHDDDPAHGRECYQAAPSPSSPVPPLTTGRQPTTEPLKLHPLGIEMLVNCAECGSILNAEICNHDERPFSKQILITVERCKCENVSKF